MPPQITCASALPVKMGKHENHIFHSIALCYTHNAPVRCLPERKKLSSVMCLIASHICWDSKTSHQYCPLTFTPGLTKNNSHLLHSDWRRETWLTESMWVTDSRMLCSLPRSCLEHPVEHSDSEGWLSSDQVIFLTVLRVFGEKACSI